MNRKISICGSIKESFLKITAASCLLVLMSMLFHGCSEANKAGITDRNGEGYDLAISREGVDNNIKRQLTSSLTAAVAVNLIPSVATPGSVQNMFNHNDIRVVDYVQKLKATDYVYMWWPQGFQAGQNKKLFFQSGKYGMAFDVKKGIISNLGAITSPLSQNDAAKQSNDIITSLTPCNTTFSLNVGGEQYPAVKFTGVDNSIINTSRIIDSGRFMQRSEIPVVKYSGTDKYQGRIEIAAQPDFFSVIYEVSCIYGEMSDVELGFSMDIDSSYTSAVWRYDKRAITFKKDDGSGITIIAPDANGLIPHLDFKSGILTLSQPGLSAKKDKYTGFSVIVMPSHKADITDADLYINMESSIKITYNSYRNDGSLSSNTVKEAVYDPTRGVFSIKLPALGVRDMTHEVNHNKYNRIKFTVTNPTDKTIKVPIAFDDNYGNSTVYIVGGAPLLRDADTLEPIGIPVQISKNWHDGAWYHLYTLIEVPAESAVEYEYTCASSKWGETFAVSHAQLCLIGYGGNQLWDESALGCYGESITYDPDMNLGRAMIDDVRPFLIDGSKDGKSGKWQWTGNVGGADFLVYFDQSNRKQILVRNKTNYIYQAPNLTNVVYTGISRDGNIEAEIITQMGRTDDVVRTYYHLKYSFIKDTTFERLALFQMAADRYGDNRFRRFAYGNKNEVLFDESVPDSGLPGYQNVNDRFIETKGNCPWFMLYDSSDIPEEVGNVMFTIRGYKAEINGKSYTQPYFNIINTKDGVFQKSFELSVPIVDNNTIKAGSTVEATVEYCILPSDKNRYYGPSDYLNAVPASEYNTTSMAVRQARDNDVKVEVSVGSLIRRHPIEIMIDASSETAAQFIISGGLGYTPLTFKGLGCYDGWRLEKKSGSSWERNDQSVMGNDYWQCYYDSAKDTYELIYNIKNIGIVEYRLVRK